MESKFLDVWGPDLEQNFKFDFSNTYSSANMLKFIDLLIKERNILRNFNKPVKEINKKTNTTTYKFNKFNFAETFLGYYRSKDISDLFTSVSTEDNYSKEILESTFGKLDNKFKIGYIIPLFAETNSYRSQKNKFYWYFVTESIPNDLKFELEENKHNEDPKIEKRNKGKHEYHERLSKIDSLLNMHVEVKRDMKKTKESEGYFMHKHFNPYHNIQIFSLASFCQNIKPNIKKLTSSSTFYLGHEKFFSWQMFMNSKSFREINELTQKNKYILVKPFNAYRIIGKVTYDVRIREIKNTPKPELQSIDEYFNSTGVLAEMEGKHIRKILLS